MAVFLITRLPSHPKSLKAVEFMQKNNLSYRISTNFPLLNCLISSGGGESLIFSAMTISEEFELGNEEKHLIDELTNIFIKEESISQSDDRNHRLEKPPIVIQAVEPTEIPLTAPPHGEQAEAEGVDDYQKERDAIHGNEEEEGLRQMKGMDESTSQYLLCNNDAHFDFDDSLSDDLQMRNEEEIIVDRDDDEVDVEDNENMEEFEEDENIDQDHREPRDDDSGEEDVDADFDEDEDSDGGVHHAQNPMSPRSLFTCLVKYCSFSHHRFEEAEEHMKKNHSGNQDFFCDVCEKDFSSKDAAIAHIQERHMKKCCGCEKTFWKTSHLVQHLRLHTGEKPFICMTCGQQFAQSGNLKSHMVTHTGEKPYSCAICKKGFGWKEYLKIHEMTHTGKKPFKCDHCDYSCKTASRLKSHNRIHTRIKPFSCGYCDKRFFQEAHLKNHELIHTGEKAFECQYCGRRFNQRGHLNRHIRLHTGEKPYLCKNCDEKFVRSEDLQKHLEKTHPT